MRWWEVEGYVGVLRYNTEFMGRFNPLFFSLIFEVQGLFLVMKLCCNFSWVIVKDFGADFLRADKNLNE